MLFLMAVRQRLADVVADAVGELFTCSLRCHSNGPSWCLMLKRCSFM